MADVPRVSPTERFILEVMGTREFYGLELVNVSEGQLKRGTIYVTLGRMEEKGVVTSRLESDVPVHGGLRRRLYQRTALGARVLSGWTKYLSHLKTEFQR